MNAIKLKGIINKKVKETNVTHQELYDVYFFEQFLERISLSKYSDVLVLKGGFLLENIVGIMERTTLDIDFSYQSPLADQSTIETIIKEVIKTKANSKIVFEFKEIFKINEESKYNGFRVKISAKLDNLRKIFSIDIASGDYITPKPSKYEFKSNLTDNRFYVCAYNIETIMAEKFETLIKRETANTRMKDFYDMYVLLNHQNLKPDYFHNAFINTFEKRNTDYNKGFLLNTLNIIKNSEVMKNRYNSYVENNRYAKNTSFNQVIESIYKLLGFIKFVENVNLHTMQLIIIRHGEDCPYNMGGWSDNELTEKGIKQTEALLPVLKQEINDIDLFLSSDLVRAKQTSQILTENLGINFILDKRFRETNNGDLANISKTEFLAKYPNLYFSNLNMDEKYPNGESPQKFYNRIKAAVINLNESHKNRKILLVTHGGVFGVIKSLVNGVEWNNKQKYQIEHGEIKRINIV